MWTTLVPRPELLSLDTQAQLTSLEELLPIPESPGEAFPRLTAWLGAAAHAGLLSAREQSHLTREVGYACAL